MNVYERLGVPTLINAVGPSTRISGGIMRPEVAQAMAEASQHCVEMTQLQARASAAIASATGAEAGIVTSGAAAAMMLGAAACATGLDPMRMNRLPDTSGMKSEIVMARSQRNFYDRSLRQAGLKLVEVGIPDRFTGAGVRDAEPWEFDSAIGPDTAAVYWLAQLNSLPPLRDVVEVAHRRGVPVIVDAAGQLPPSRNLRRFIDEGADLVAISGGKGLGGPQASGILAGQRDLVQAAALQMMDQDELFALWEPPSSLFDKARLPGLPQHGIGRVAKAGKEEIVGLLTAMELYLAEGDAARTGRWKSMCQTLIDALENLPGANAQLRADQRRPGLWLVELQLDAAAGLSALDLLTRLQSGSPPIFAIGSRVAEGVVTFSPWCLKPEEPILVANRVRTLLRG